MCIEISYHERINVQAFVANGRWTGTPHVNIVLWNIDLLSHGVVAMHAVRNEHEVSNFFISDIVRKTNSVSDAITEAACHGQLH